MSWCTYNSISGQLSKSVNSYCWIIWNFCSCYCSSNECDREIHKHLHWTQVKLIMFLQKKRGTGDQSIVKKKIDKHEKRRADWGYMKQYMKKTRASADFRKRENQNSMQRYNNIKTIREKKNQTATKKKMTNPVHIREIDKRSKRKGKTENPDHIKEISKKL